MDGKEASVSGKSPSETIYGNPVRSIKINPLHNATEVSEDTETNLPANNFSVVLSTIFLFFEQETGASFFASLSMAAFCTSLAAARKTRAVSLRAERCVIASGALCHCERSVVSLRAERSNLGSRGKGDCFAPLAMT
jgi:hypothetical protein